MDIQAIVFDLIVMTCSISDAKERESILTSDNLFESGILDSLSVIELIGRLENHFNLEFRSSDLTAKNLKSLASVANLVEAKLLT